MILSAITTRASVCWRNKTSFFGAETTRERLKTRRSLRFLFYVSGKHPRIIIPQFFAPRLFISHTSILIYLNYNILIYLKLMYSNKLFILPEDILINYDSCNNWNIFLSFFQWVSRANARHKIRSILHPTWPALVMWIFHLCVAELKSDGCTGKTRAQGRGEARKTQRWRFQFRATRNFSSKFVSSLTRRFYCNVNCPPISSTTSIHRM